MKKFAFILMGPAYDPEKHQCCFHKEDSKASETHIYTVRNFEEAKEKVVNLQKEGYGAIELCGAFGKEKAAELAELTNHQVAIGYVVHEPELDPLFVEFFGH